MTSTTRRTSASRTASGSAEPGRRTVISGKRTSSRSRRSRSTPRSGCVASWLAMASRQRRSPRSGTSSDPQTLTDRLRPALRDLQARRPAVQRHRSAHAPDRPTPSARSSSSSRARPIPPTDPDRASSRRIFGTAAREALRGQVFILEDYDMRVGRYLVQGVDVWLNNPRRPLEASGTSGMKAAMNGVPQRVHPGRLVGRGLRGRQRLGHRRSRPRP